MRTLNIDFGYVSAMQMREKTDNAGQTCQRWPGSRGILWPCWKLR
jgi:hypothetical protein